MAGLLGDILSPVLGAFGVNAAGDEQRKALNYAMQRLKTGYGGAEAALQPLYGGSLGVFQDMLSKYRAGEYDPRKFNFQEDPGYKYALEQGLEQIRSRAGAEGMGQSPLTTRALGAEAIGQAQQGYNQAFARNLAGSQAAFGAGQSLMGNLLPSAQGIGSARIGLGTSLADIEAQKGDIGARTAYAPYGAGMNFLGSETAQGGGKNLLNQLMLMLSKGGGVGIA